MKNIKILEESNSIPEKISIFNEKDFNPYEKIAKNILNNKI